jgi:Putative transposase
MTFRYKDSRDHRRKTMTLPAHEFLRRFLQHVPPKGLHRVRAFGLIHPAQGHDGTRPVVAASTLAR